MKAVEPISHMIGLWVPVFYQVNQLIEPSRAPSLRFVPRHKALHLFLRAFFQAPGHLE